MTRQLDLFPAVCARPTQRVAAVPQEPDVHALAQALPSTLHLGTSSWSFPGWAGLVYDWPGRAALSARESLAAYAAHPLLRTVGLDRTFRAPLPEAVYRGYAEAVPPTFRFVVNAHQDCTWAGRGRPNPRFLDPAHAEDHVIGPAWAGLGERLGLVLFQVPQQDMAEIGPRGRFAERLAVFLQALPRGPRYAVELRTHQLFTPAYAQALASAGVAHCFNVHPAMHELSHQRKHLDPGAQVRGPDPEFLHGPFGPELGFMVVRWSLHRQYRHAEARAAFSPFERLVEPDPRALAAVTELVAEAMLAGRDTFVVVDNEAEGCAPVSVERLARALVEFSSRALAGG